MDKQTPGNKAIALGAGPKRAAALGHTAARGAAYSGMAQILKILILMASTVAAARLLPPADFGVIAMTEPVTGFILIFQNLGLNEALVQARHLTSDQINTMFFYNIAASIIIALILILISPLVGLFYHDIRPEYVTAASAVTLLVTGSTLQHTALINRHMRYRALAVIDVAVAATNLAATICFALWLHSYWSLWLGSLSGAVVNAILVWRIDHWRPSRRIMWRETRDFLKFGANLTGFNLLNYISRNLDSVLIAKFWGAVSLGLYNRSYKLMLFPIQSINAPLSRVMLPILAKLQDEPERYRRTFVLAIRAIALASVPGVMAAAMCSQRIVPFLLGHQWANASPIFFWLSLAAITQPVSNATGWLFISTGRTGALFRWTLISMPIMIASFAAGLPWGARGVAEAYFISQALRIPILYRWSTRDNPVHAGDLYAALLPTLAGGGIAWLIVAKIGERLPTGGLLIVALLAAYAFSTAAQAATQGGRFALAETYRLISASLRKRRAGPAVP